MPGEDALEIWGARGPMGSKEQASSVGCGLGLWGAVWGWERGDKSPLKSLQFWGCTGMALERAGTSPLAGFLGVPAPMGFGVTLTPQRFCCCLGPFECL